VLTAVLGLFAIIGVGSLVGATGVLRDPRAVITWLNRYALYLAFPLLIAHSLATAEMPLQTARNFGALHVAVVPAYVLVALLGIRALGGRERNVIMAGALFGNIAYLGIPFCEAVLGPESRGLASLAAAIHIVIGMLSAPILLVRAGGAGDSQRPSWSQTLARIAKQPLIWAPFVGFALRALSPTVTSTFAIVAQPIGSTAGPVALFMLGLYMWTERARLLDVGKQVVTLTALKLLVYPAVALAVTLALDPLLDFRPLEARVFLLICAMPVAITTFSLAEEFDAGREVLATSIVLSTLVSLATLSAMAALILL